MDQILKNQKLLNSSSRYKTSEQPELAFTPKPFVSSRASKILAKQESLIKLPEDKLVRNQKKVNFEVNSNKKELDTREYGPTMPPELFQGERSKNFCNEEDQSVSEVFEKDIVEEGVQLKDQCEENEKEDGLGKDDKIVIESGNVDIRENTNKYPLHTYQPRFAQSSLKHAQLRKIEKSSLEPQPLFSSLLSAEDMERIKKVKEFVKSKDTPQQKTVSLELMPFKNDPIKNKRCFNFFCEMEGLEIGGVSAARLMTASEIRKERQEFNDFYQLWKNSDSSQITNPDPGQVEDSRVLTQSDFTLPTKRPATQASSQHLHKSNPHSKT